MKENDIMLSDWVRRRWTCSDTGREVVKDFQVTEIHKLGNSLYAWGKNGNMGRVEQLEPISLTAEILEKNGWKHEFDKKDYMVKYDLAVEGKNCWMMWAIKEHNLDIQRQDEKLNMYNLKVQRACIPCDYIHQLQHALRLCGIDLDIAV